MSQKQKNNLLSSYRVNSVIDAILARDTRGLFLFIHY